MTNIKNIERRNGDPNIYGAAKLYFVPAHLVIAIPKPDAPGKINNAITLSASQKWYYWICTMQTIGAGYKKQKSRSGSTYMHQVTGFIAGDNSDFIAMMQEMEDMRFIALRKDNNGFYKLLGSIESPLEFTYEYMAPATGRKGFQFSMSRECRTPEYFYEGNLETETGFVDTAVEIVNFDISTITAFYAGPSFVTS